MYTEREREREREIYILLEISNSMKPYASVFHACASKLRPEISLFEPNNLDECSNRIPPTSQDREAESRRDGRDGRDGEAVEPEPAPFRAASVLLVLILDYY